LICWLSMELKGKRVLITRSRVQTEEFARMLITEGVEPIFFPVIEIVPLDDFSELDSALHHLDRYDWLILTSIHSVYAIFARLRTLEIDLSPKHLHTAAIGPKTALCLSEYGITPDFVPPEYIAEAILSGLGDITEKHFLLPQSDIARHTLADAIRAAGGVPHEIVVYRNIPTKPDPASINVLRSGADVITFASPSSVKGFIAVLGEHSIDVHSLSGDPLIACIGPVTASAAREAGLCVDVEAKEHTISGLITALKSA
jgi:uroporphyrinogen III methyltransferase / synthase